MTPQRPQTEVWPPRPWWEQKKTTPVLQDPHPLWIIWYAASLHVIWGLVLIIGGETLHTTGIDSILRFVTHPFLAGTGLVLVGLASGIALWWPPVDSENRIWRAVHIGLLVPQQVLLLMSAAGACKAVALSQFADGVIRSRAFILVDQLPIMLIAIFHTLAIVRLDSLKG